LKTLARTLNKIETIITLLIPNLEHNLPPSIVPIPNPRIVAMPKI